MNKYAKIACNIKMSLLAKGIKIEKICTNMWEVYVFERDMPCKHGLLFSKTPYIVGKVYLDRI